MKRRYLLKKDKLDLRDKIYRPKVKDPSALPKKVDLRSQLSPVVDQGQLGSCTANAIGAGLMEYLEKKQLRNDTKDFVSLSRLFLYYQERKLEGTINSDSGAQLRDGMKVVHKIGVCPETDDPYDISKFTNTPSKKAEKDAPAHRIDEYHRVSSLHTLKAALAEGHPVVIGMIVFESFEGESAQENGFIPTPKHGEQELGGHALLAAGYDDTLEHDGNKGYLIVRNSWGDAWGDKGYCYIPYDFVALGLITDMWKGY